MSARQACWIMVVLSVFALALGLFLAPYLQSLAASGEAELPLTVKLGIVAAEAVKLGSAAMMLRLRNLVPTRPAILRHALLLAAGLIALAGIGGLYGLVASQAAATLIVQGIALLALVATSVWGVGCAFAQARGRLPILGLSILSLGAALSIPAFPIAGFAAAVAQIAFWAVLAGTRHPEPS